MSSGFSFVGRALLLSFVFLGLLGGAEAFAQKEILIGGTVAQSGKFQGITRPFTKLAHAWADSVNKKGGIYLKKLDRSLPVRFIIYDDKSDPATSKKFYDRLATVDKVDIFIGPFSSLITNAASQAADTYKKPFFMSAANDPVMFDKKHEWRTTGLTKTEDEYSRLAELFAAKKGVKTFALLSIDSLHEKIALEGFGKKIKKAGFKVVYQETIPRGTKDFSSIVLNIKRKKPDVVFLEGLFPPWNIGFMKKARQMGLKPKDFVIAHMPVPVIKALGKYTENIISNLYYFAGNSADHKNYLALTKKVGFEPWQFSEAGIRYTTYRTIEEVLKIAGSLDADDIRKAMWASKVKVWGDVVIEHDELGYGTFHPFPTQIRKGKHVSLWPLKTGVKRMKHKNR